MRRYLFPFLILSVIGGAFLFTYVRFERQAQFPDLPPGSYIGVARGIMSDPNEKTTFYIERSSATESFIVSFLEEGLKLEKIEGKRLLEATTKSKAASFEPLLVTLGEKKLLMSGKPRGGEFEGSFEDEKKKVGSWNLRLLPLKESSPRIKDLEKSKLDLMKWLDLKVVFLSLKEQFRGMRTSREQKEEYFEKLNRFIADEALLKERATERRVELAGKLQIAKENHSKSSEQVAALVSELDLLGRITKHGKAVSLARRVASRETKWYLANWTAVEDPSGIEEYLGESPEINIQQLDASVKRASEVRSLINELNNEKQRIEELEAKLEEQLHPAPESLPEEDEPIRKRKKSFWNEIFSFLVPAARPAFAEEPENISDFSIDADVGIVDRLVVSEFMPTKSVVLIESAIGQVIKYPAQFVVDETHTPEGLSGAKQYLVGARIPLEVVAALPEYFRFVFVVSNDADEYSQSVVGAISKENLKKGSKIEKAYAEMIDNLKNKIAVQKEEMQAFEAKLAPLREKAAQVARIDDIVDLKMALARLQGFSEQNEAETERLKKLVELGKNAPELPDIYQRIQDLSINLQETARVTAMADRLSSSRREAAIAGLQQKLVLVREAKNHDREALAREVLTLRRKRKTLEAQLHLDSPERTNEF